MGTCYAMACKKHKKYIYIGKSFGNKGSLWIGDEKQMQIFWHFLNKHQQCNLRFVSEYYFDIDEFDSKADKVETSKYKEVIK